MRYSQGHGVHTHLDWLVLYPRSVVLVGVVVLCIVLPSARSRAIWDDNNKDDVCTRTIPAGLKCPPPSKAISPIPRLDAYLNSLSERIPRKPTGRFSVFKPRTLRKCRYLYRMEYAERSRRIWTTAEERSVTTQERAGLTRPGAGATRRGTPRISRPALRTPLDRSGSDAKKGERLLLGT